MLTVKEAAKKLSVEPQTVRNYIRVGLTKDKVRLNAIQVHHGARLEYRIKQDDLEEFRKMFLV